MRCNELSTITKVPDNISFVISSFDYAAAFQNVTCFVFEPTIVFLNAPLKNLYNVLYFKTLSVCIFNAVKKQTSIGFIVDALFGNFAYLHSLYTIVELHTNFVLIHFGRQPHIFIMFSLCRRLIIIIKLHNSQRRKRKK